MAGCFGNSPFDKAMEHQLDRYLDSLEGGEEIEVSKCCECSFDTDGDNKLCMDCGEPCTTITIIKEE